MNTAMLIPNSSQDLDEEEYISECVFEKESDNGTYTSNSPEI